MNWTEIMSLYNNDRETFFKIACDNNSDHPLANLAKQIRIAIRSTYKIHNNILYPYKKNFSIPIPEEFVNEVKNFLLDIDGKTIGNIPGKDYIGVKVSEYEVIFKLSPLDD
jgi:hypothetical protein